MVYIQLEKTDFEVLGFLIKNLNEEFSIKGIAERLKRPYVKVHSSVNRLTDKNIIREEIKGKSHYCSVDYKNNLDVVCFISSQKAKEFLLKNKKIKLIIEDIIANMKIPSYTLLIFGSYAKGTFDKHSDLDLAIITSSEDKEAAERVINSKKRLSLIEIHSLEFSYKEFVEMLKSREINVGNEIVKNQIIFKGCEQFYDAMNLAI